MTHQIRHSDPDPSGLATVVDVVAPGGRVVGSRVLSGGVDSAMHRVEVALPSDADFTFVLRRAITERDYDVDVARLAATLEALEPTPIPTPEVLWVDADGAAFGRPALAMSLLPGRSRSVDAVDDLSVVRAFAAGCASLQAVTDLSSFGHLDHLPDAASHLRPIQERHLPEVPFADTSLVRDALVTTGADLTDVEVGLCHGDLHIGNVLFDDICVTGIVDWDGARLADPRVDLGYAAMDLAIYAGLEVADAFIAEYEALRGPTRDRDWWCLYASRTTWFNVHEWLPGWNDIGIDLDLATVHDRLRRWTDRHLAGLA